LTDQLQQASHALTQQMYQQGNGAGPTGEPTADGSQDGTGRSEDDVVEGEFRQA
jgi:hypothetical protein